MNLKIKMVLLVVIPIVVMWIASLFVLNYLGDMKEDIKGNITRAELISDEVSYLLMEANDLKYAVAKFTIKRGAKEKEDTTVPRRYWKRGLLP